MTAEKLHDAIGLLPADLITETDTKRSRKPRVIPWRRYAAMAACLALMLYSGWFFTRFFAPKGAMEDSKEFEAAQAPMETAAAAKEASDAAEAPAAKEETMCALPAAPTWEESAAEDTGSNSASAAGDQTLCIDHSHMPAEASEDTENRSGGWCGNMTATVYFGGEAYFISGSDAVTLTDILFCLDYAPARLCSCMAEFTADTEMGTGYEINLTEYFARFDGGQAALTKQQADALREIFAALGE